MVGAPVLARAFVARIVIIIVLGLFSGARVGLLG